MLPTQFGSAMGDFNGKTAVITGAGSGIGRATALHFAKLGVRVVASDIHSENIAETVTQIEAAGGIAIGVQTDVTNYEDIEALVQEAVQTYGRLDIMVNNAGIGPEQMLRTSQHTLDDWHRVIAVNQTGVFYGMKAALQVMEKQGSGNVVNVASLAGLKASGKNLSYAASKFAVVGMTKSAALEYAGHHIRINAVCPGYTESALLDHLKGQHPDMENILLSFIPMKRFGQASEIAEAIAWLSGDSSKFVTGQALVLDGGTSL